MDLHKECIFLIISFIYFAFMDFDKIVFFSYRYLSISFWGRERGEGGGGGGGGRGVRRGGGILPLWVMTKQLMKIFVIVSLPA